MAVEMEVALMPVTAEMVKMLLPAYQAEGKAYFTIALGCTGGRHRSVTIAEILSRDLATAGWPVSTRHRELEGHGKVTR